MQAVIDAPDHGAGVVDRNRAFALLRRQLNDAGLMDRTYGYYAGQGLLWSTFLIVSIIGALQIPQLGIVAATMIAFSSVQIGLLGHDAGHRAVFKSSAFNVVLGTACWSLVLGISFWYWNDRHLRHHANVNDVQSDPDLQWIGVLASTRDAPYRGRECWRRIYESLQGPGYSLGLAFTFRLDGWRFALRRLRGRRRRVELLLLASSLMLWLWPCLVIGPRWLLVYVAAQVLGGLSGHRSKSQGHAHLERRPIA